MKKNETLWQSIDSQEDLDRLDQSVCWDDSRTVEFCGIMHSEDYYPYDISRSGCENMNLHLLVESSSPRGDYLHLVLIDCGHADYFFIQCPVLAPGRVDVLKRIEIYSNLHDSYSMRCSRMIY